MNLITFRIFYREKEMNLITFHIFYREEEMNLITFHIFYREKEMNLITFHIFYREKEMNLITFHIFYREKEAKEEQERLEREREEEEERLKEEQKYEIFLYHLCNVKLDTCIVRYINVSNPVTTSTLCSFTTRWPCFVKRKLNASVKSFNPGQPEQSGQDDLGRNVLLLVNFVHVQGPVYITEIH